MCALRHSGITIYNLITAETELHKLMPHIHVYMPIYSVILIPIFFIFAFRREIKSTKHIDTTQYNTIELNSIKVDVCIPFGGKIFATALHVSILME